MLSSNSLALCPYNAPQLSPSYQTAVRPALAPQRFMFNGGLSPGQLAGQQSISCQGICPQLYNHCQACSPSIASSPHNQSQAHCQHNQCNQHNSYGRGRSSSRCHSHRQSYSYSHSHSHNQLSSPFNRDCSCFRSRSRSRRHRSRTRSRSRSRRRSRSRQSSRDWSVSVEVEAESCQFFGLTRSSCWKVQIPCKISISDIYRVILEDSNLDNVFFGGIEIAVEGKDGTWGVLQDSFLNGYELADYEQRRGIKKFVIFQPGRLAILTAILNNGSRRPKRSR